MKNETKLVFNVIPIKLNVLLTDTNLYRKKLYKSNLLESDPDLI